ncbi:hypothetical protein [Natrinema sp. 1APR25-10V2]|uniref:SPW repeat domain-containing protein n=1 Tax=Natrinema sp. 1APR25-10V2 TaxID=2951081 RepID=UPI002877124A|nr:hypothetical protein [Natrinema sp. 1APR25-10V2]MDS0476905.1 hypothetical protein [Natrinema sp. 1APR25-10V2]
MSDEPNTSSLYRYNTLNADTIRWISALIALIGFYLVVSPFFLNVAGVAIWNSICTGMTILFASGHNFVRLSRDRLASVSVASLTVLLGLWALLSPLIIEMGSSVLATSTAIAGVIVAALSAYNAYANKKADISEQALARV